LEEERGGREPSSLDWPSEEEEEEEEEGEEGVGTAGEDLEREGEEGGV
jgi:hypothetical protein